MQKSNPRDWVIWSNEHRMWWSANRCGYTSSQAEAGRYSLEEATDICHQANRYVRAGEPPQEIISPSPEMVLTLLSESLGLYDMPPDNPLEKLPK